MCDVGTYCNGMLHENCALLDVIQRVVISYGRFGTTYRSHHQESRNQIESIAFFLDS
jgi:hypothetical protein